MVFAGNAVQPIEFFNGLQGIADVYINVFFLRPLDIALCAAFKGGKYFGIIPFQLDRVSILSILLILSDTFLLFGMDSILCI